MTPPRVSLAGAIFGGVGLVLLTATGVTLWYALRPLRWPPVIATVTSSRVLTEPGAMYRAEHGFRYLVGGTEYSVVDSAGWSSSSYAMVEGAVTEFPAGSRREIRVNPNDPRDVSTTRRVSFTTVLAPVILGTLALVFGGIGAWALLPARRPAPREMTPEERMAMVRSQGAFPVHLFRWVFLPVGVVFVAVAALSGRQKLEESRWPAVAAEVTASRVDDRGRRGVRYSPWIEFRYQVGDRQYVTPTWGAVWTSSRGSVEETVREYAPETRHEIRVDPQRPGNVRYGPAFTFSTLLFPLGMLMGGLVFLGFGIAFPLIFRGM